MDKTRTLLEIVVPVADYQDVEKTVSTHAARTGMEKKTALLLPSEKSSSPPFVRALVERMSAETSVEHVSMQNPGWAFFHPQRAAECQQQPRSHECAASVSEDKQHGDEVEQDAVERADYADNEGGGVESG